MPYTDPDELDTTMKNKYSSGDYDRNDPDITRIDNIISAYTSGGYLDSLVIKVTVISDRIKAIQNRNFKIF